jgi:D-alanine transaminase
VSLAYLNGQWGLAENMRVPVLDRGFLFGDGVYEVIPVYRGRLFRLHEHLARLERSLEGARIPQPWPRFQWVDLLEELVWRSATSEPAVYLQVTRGAAMRAHPFPPGTRPTVFAMGMPRVKRHQGHGVSAVVREDNRWQRCDIKAIALLANILLHQEAIDAGAAESILVRDGWLTEGASSNVFVVHEGQVLTPPTGPRLLAGITRALVLELASEAGIACAEQPVSLSVLGQASEVWLTASTMEMMPVVMIDGTAVGDGKPGPVWNRLNALFREYVLTTRSVAQLGG